VCRATTANDQLQTLMTLRRSERRHERAMTKPKSPSSDNGLYNARFAADLIVIPHPSQAGKEGQSKPCRVLLRLTSSYFCVYQIQPEAASRGMAVKLPRCLRGNVDDDCRRLIQVIGFLP